MAGGQLSREGFHGVEMLHLDLFFQKIFASDVIEIAQELPIVQRRHALVFFGSRIR